MDKEKLYEELESEVTLYFETQWVNYTEDTKTILWFDLPEGRSASCKCLISVNNRHDSDCNCDNGEFSCEVIEATFFGDSGEELFSDRGYLISTSITY